MKLSKSKIKEVRTMAQDPQPQYLELVMDGIKYILISTVSWLAWVFRRHSQKINDLEMKTIPREEYNSAMMALRADIKEATQGTHERLDKLYLHLSSKRNDNN